LTFGEIVGAYAKKRSKITNDLLAVQRDSEHKRFVCGTDAFFTARMVGTTVQAGSKNADKLARATVIL
jgi:hypothetical protein